MPARWLIFQGNDRCHYFLLPSFSWVYFLPTTRPVPPPSITDHSRLLSCYLMSLLVFPIQTGLYLRSTYPLRRACSRALSQSRTIHVAVLPNHVPNPYLAPILPFLSPCWRLPSCRPVMPLTSHLFAHCPTRHSFRPDRSFPFPSFLHDGYTPTSCRYNTQYSSLPLGICRI
jgi:hypothetical protein